MSNVREEKVQQWTAEPVIDKNSTRSALSIRLSPRSHSSASPSLPEATNPFHSPRHDCILDLIFLFSATFAIQFKYKSSSSGTKNDDSRDSTVSKLADSAVMRSLMAFNVLVRFIQMDTHTSMNPYDGDCDDYEQIRSFEQEHIPQSKMGLIRNGIRKERDVPLCCVRRRRNYVRLESRVDVWHHFLGDTFLNVYRFEQTRKSRAKDVMHVVGIMEMNE
jgi:hypothetical protein